MSLSFAHRSRLALPGGLWRTAIWAAVLLGIAAVIAILDPFYVPLAALAGVLAVVIVVHPLVAVPLLLFAVPFGGLARPDAAESDLAAGPTEVLVAFLALAWLADGVRQQRIRMRDGAIVVAILAFSVLSLLSIGYAIQPGPAVKESLKWLELLVVVVVVVDLARTQRSVSWLLATLFVAGAGEALYGVYQFATGGGPATFEVEGALRAFGHFDQPNPFAGYLSTILPLAVLIVFCGPAARPLRACAAVSALAIAAGVALSQSRGAWLGVATAVLVLLVLWSPRSRLLLLPIAAVTAVFGAAALGNLLPASVADRLSQAVEYFGVFDVRTVQPTSENWAVVERMAHWQAAWYMFLDHPWLGVGAGNYASAYPFYYVATWLEPLGHAHNYYLNTLAELGAVGLAILLVLLALLFRELAGGLRTTTPVGMSFWRAVLAGVVGALVVFCVHNMFDNLFVHSVNVQLGVMIGIGLVAADRLKEARGS
jgi:O-antigen ligase